MILSFVVPELIFGVAMFFVFTQMPGLHGIRPRHWSRRSSAWSPGTSAGPPSSCRPGWSRIGKQYEEASADLGCTQLQTMRRVMLPLLMPAIFASAILVFSGVIDDFVIVDLLSSNASEHPDVGDHLLDRSTAATAVRR